MKQLLLLTLAFLAPLPLAAQDRSEPWTVEQGEVIEMMRRGPVGIERNFDGWAGSYASSWTYWRLGAETTRDRETHLGLVRDFLAAGNQVLDFELGVVDVQILGDVAVVRANAQEVIRDPAGQRQVIRYSTLTVLGRRDGAWRYLSSNLFYPPPEDGPEG